MVMAPTLLEGGSLKGQGAIWATGGHADPQILSTIALTRTYIKGEKPGTQNVFMDTQGQWFSNFRISLGILIYSFKCWMHQNKVAVIIM